MNRRPLVRLLLASAAIAAAVTLGGCDTETSAPISLRSLQPLSPQMVAEIDKRQMRKESPILVRIFKEESELEVWKEDQSGRMALLKTYPICRWSGDLGPKIKQGDRQAPEGFYTITPSLMNPNSSYYLSINLGYPNAYDRSNNRTGSFLMIHGDCSSAGCYAMTDEQVAEIYALARESFFGGQASFQIQAMPFRMTAQNMARHRNSPHMPFWRMLKVGYDHFEVTRQEPKVDVCDRRYVFNTEASGRYTPTAACPAMRTPDDVMAAVKTKQQRDDAQVADLVRRGTSLPATRSFADGSMHPTFLASVSQHNVDEDGVLRTRTSSPAGTIPANIRLPTERTNASRATTKSATGSVSEPAVRDTRTAATQSSTGSGNAITNLLASGGNASSGSQPAASSSSSSPGMMDRMRSLVGLGSSESSASAPAAKAKPAPTKTATKTKPTDKKEQTAKQTGKPAAQPKSEPAEQKTASTQPSAPAAPAAGSSGAFENRFGAWR